MTYPTLRLERRGPAAWIWMNRPEVHNAFDETLIADLTAAFAALDAKTGTSGPSCSPARARAFRPALISTGCGGRATAPLEDNVADARVLADAATARSHCARTPTLARVHGAALGGGMGLAAACDICVASTPGPVRDFRGAARASSRRRSDPMWSALSASGRPIATSRPPSASALTRAREIGLVHEVVPPEELDAKVAARSLRRCSRAVRAANPLRPT